MGWDPSHVAMGALASYGSSIREGCRLAARHVERILAGTPPQDLPVQAVDRVGLSLNLRTAQALGLTIPPSVLLRAEELVR
jgi:putative ABC transport system substrate-binding protein